MSQKGFFILAFLLRLAAYVFTPTVPYFTIRFPLAISCTSILVCAPGRGLGCHVEDQRDDRQHLRQSHDVVGVACVAELPRPGARRPAARVARGAHGSGPDARARGQGREAAAAVRVFRTNQAVQVMAASQLLRIRGSAARGGRPGPRFLGHSVFGLEKQSGAIR